MAIGRRGWAAAVFLLVAAGVYNMGADIVVEMLHAKSAAAQVQLHALRESMAPQLAAAQLKLHAAQVQALAFGTSTAKTAGEHLSDMAIHTWRSSMLPRKSPYENLSVAKVKAAEQFAAASEQQSRQLSSLQMAVAKVKAAKQFAAAGEQMAVSKAKATEYLAAAKAQVGVYSTVAEQILGAYSAIARVKAEEYSAITRSKAGECSAITRAKAEEYSAIARVKAEEYSAAGRIKADEYSQWLESRPRSILRWLESKPKQCAKPAQFLYSSGQNVSRSLSACAYARTEEFKEWLRSGSPAVLQQLQAKALSAGRTFGAMSWYFWSRPD